MLGLLISLVSLNAHAATLRALDAKSYLDGARPVIERFLEAQAREYQTPLEPDPNTYEVRRPTGVHIWNTYSQSWPSVYWSYATPKSLDFDCREVDVDLPARAVRARFAVVAAKHKSEDSPEFILGRSCLPMEILQRPRLELEPLAAAHVRLTPAQILETARPLVTNWLHDQGVTADPASFRVKSTLASRWGLYDCRRIRFRVPSRSAVGQAYLLIDHDESEPVGYRDARLQTVRHDPRHLRATRFALVRGCHGANQLHPPELTLRTVRREFRRSP